MVKSSITPSINLAKNRGETFVDQFLTWALTVGRVLIIITEAVALGAFLYRFGLDRQLIDLHDKIKQQTAILQLLKQNESTYRNLQDRLALANVIDSQLGKELKLYQDISSYIPSDMVLQNISLSSSFVRVDGSVPSVTSLAGLVKKLQANPNIDRVSLDKLENRSTEGQISISITAFLKNSIEGKISL